MYINYVKAQALEGNCKVPTFALMKVKISHIKIAQNYNMLQNLLLQPKAFWL